MLEQQSLEINKRMRELEEKMEKFEAEKIREEEIHDMSESKSDDFSDSGMGNINVRTEDGGYAMEVLMSPPHSLAVEQRKEVKRKAIAQRLRDTPLSIRAKERRRMRVEPIVPSSEPATHTAEPHSFTPATPSTVQHSSRKDLQRDRSWEHATPMQVSREPKMDVASTHQTKDISESLRQPSLVSEGPQHNSVATTPAQHAASTPNHFSRLPSSIATHSPPSKKVYLPSSTCDNSGVVRSALKNTVLASHVMSAALEDALIALKDEGRKEAVRRGGDQALHTARLSKTRGHFIIAFRNKRSLQYLGLFIIDSSNGMLRRISGKGPASVDQSKVSEAFKYDSGAREFKVLGTNKISSTVSGVVWRGMSKK
ncbi:hypothetical protein ADUPG1_008369 [Aduncisulcus paluster]|uniref:CKK domain-containing protein n=1 Tax=Aduncisulcus paluster TaxID=2918883 RepID=A0ABQ5KRP7_9EUKA|nr:hypothetical protein ADUPG1_008369 [Aduncisulcus paluster]